MQTVMEIPQEFERLFDRDWREAALYGGRNSLKSHTVARYLLIRARQKKTRVGCFREFQSSIAESSHQLLKDLIQLYHLTDFEVTNNAIVNKINGSDFLFKGLYGNEQTIKSIEGIDIAWVEEAQTISTSSIEVLTPTVRKPGSQIIYTYNRFLENDPVHVRLVQEGRPNTLIINVNYDVALKYGWMPQVLINEMEDDKQKRPALYKHKWLGLPNTLEQKILKDWVFIDEIPPEARLERHCVDPGYTNDETGIVDLYSYNGAYIWDEIAYLKGLQGKQIADILLQLPKALSIFDSADPRLIDEVKAYGLLIMPVSKTKGETSQETFVKWSFGIIQNAKVMVTKRSLNLIKEYNNLLWMTDKDGRIIHVENPACKNHLIAAGRYGMVSLAPIKRREEQNAQLRQFPPKRHTQIAL